MWKIDIEADGRWVERDAERRFTHETSLVGSRLRFVLPRSRPHLVRELSSALQGPLQLLYVLHTSRGEGPEGRYQSPTLTQDDVDAFLTRYAGFLNGDARYDLWIRSTHSNTVLVWDRHNDVYLYDAPPNVVERLTGLGFKGGDLDPLGAHTHHYRAEFDGDAREILTAFAWTRTALRPEDEQDTSPVANDR
jgi:hypothetical protein